jgi:hypothetical protein
MAIFLIKIGIRRFVDKEFSEFLTSLINAYLNRHYLQLNRHKSECCGGGN